MKVIPYRGDYLVVDGVSGGWIQITWQGVFKKRYCSYSMTEAIKMAKREITSRLRDSGGTVVGFLRSSYGG